MILCLDLGNTDLYGGVYEGETLRLEFRRNNQSRPTADEVGVFLREVFAAHDCDLRALTAVSVASVVPDALPGVVEGCRRYLGLEPLVLRVGVKTGLNLRVKEPREVGADRIATAIGAAEAFPGQDVLVIDLGTATKFCVVSARAEYLGGVIAPGIKLSMRSLAQGTAQLPVIDLERPASVLGKTTVTNLQSGLYYGHVGLLREVTRRLAEEVLGHLFPVVLGTGGYAPLFADEGLFTHHSPDLVLRGLRRALILNASTA